MIRNITSLVCLYLVFLMGCSNDNFTLTEEMTQIAERNSGSFATNSVPKKIADMETNDVIVAVNGYPLTKQAFEDFMELRLEGLSKGDSMNSLALSQMMDEQREKYIPNFIGQRLLVDNAYELGIVTTEEVLSSVEKKLKKAAHKTGKTVDEYLKRFKGREKYFLYESCVSYVINKLTSMKIPPKLEVSPEFVAAVQHQTDLDNAAAEETNKLFKARLADYRRQILAKDLDFAELAKAMGSDEDGEGGWDEFEEGDMDDPAIQAAAFALREGEISDVVEGEESLELIKVLQITPAETNESGRVVSRERRKLSHISIEKVPMIIRSNDIQLTSELKAQMQTRAVSEYVTGLSTNKATRIEFPNGESLF